MAASSKDLHIIDELKAGRSSAYETLYKEYFGMVRHFVQHNSGDETEAGDVFQDAIIVLFEKVQQADFTLTATLKTYLYSVSRNIWLKRLREKKPTTVLREFESPVEVELEEKELTERQLTIVEQCMEKLGDPCKTLLHKFYFLKESMQEIAAALNYTNAQNAKNQKYKCLQRLRKLALEAAG